MTRIQAITLITALAASAGAAPSDLLRFTNGDQLHGSYLGMNADRQIVWQRDDISEAAKFQSDNLRHLILRDGYPAKPLGSLSQVELINGDCIPGVVTSLDESTLTVETACAGTITLPRNMVAAMAPNPLGGRIHYYGPFSSDGWQTIQPADSPTEQAEIRAEDDQQVDAEAAADGQDAAQQQETGDAESWKQAGAAWYWKGETDQTATALIRRDALPEQSSLRFQLAWKSRPLIAIGINTDFDTGPAAAPGAGDNERNRMISSTYRTMPMTFGNGYVLRIQSNYLSIYRTGIDEEGKPLCENVTSTNNRLPIDDDSKADFEIRSSRSTGETVLFVNGQFITQWNAFGGNGDQDKDRAIRLGSGFGFLPFSNDSRLRISEVVISDWNGMPDSARSTQSDEHDVALMSNGLDRIAGKATAITGDRMLVFNSRHGEFRIPLDEIARVRFADNSLAEPPSHSQDSVTIRFSPIGNISGEPVSATRDAMKIKHPVIGDLEFSTESAVMFEFNATSSLINDWDADF